MPALLPHNVSVSADLMINNPNLDQVYNGLMRMDKDCAIYAAFLIATTIYRDNANHPSLVTWIDDLRGHINQRLANK